jgi:hypothetical protein
MRSMRAALLIVSSVLAAAAIAGLGPAPDASLPMAPRRQPVPLPALMAVATPAPLPGVIVRRRPIAAPPRSLTGAQANEAQPLADGGTSVPALLPSRPLALELPSAVPPSEAGRAMQGSPDPPVEPVSATGAVTRGVVTAGEQISGAVTRAGRAIRATF